MYLNAHSWFSFKYGTMSIVQLLKQAAEMGHQSLALTDINNTSGIPDFVRLAPEYGIKPVAGIDFRNGSVQLFTGIARNNEGFRELNDFLSFHLHHDIPLPDTAPVFKHAVVIYPLPWQRATSMKGSELQQLQPPEGCYWGVKPEDLVRLPFSPFRDKLLNCVMFVSSVFYDKTGYNIHRLLRAIDLNSLLSKVPATELAAPDDRLCHRYELIRQYGRFPQLIDNTMALLDSCSIAFGFGKNKNKQTFTGNIYEDELLLLKLCRENLRYRYPEAPPAVVKRYEHEIKTITRLGFASYFLINHDIVSYAQHKNYFYVGRGSGANSLVAYLLRITDVDPVDLDLYFERFINAYRTSPPDFDLDFSWRDRDDVIAYIFKRHGRTHVAQLAAYNTFQSNAVIRELGKVFGLPKAEIDALSEQKKHPSTNDRIAGAVMNFGRKLIDFPNHLSIHAGGILIAEQPIHCYTATSIPPKGFPITQFSMLEAEDLGLYKFDILSQRGLAHIREATELVKQNRGITIDIHQVQKFKQDEKVKEKLRRAECMGCFYIESPAMRMLLKKLEVDNYLGLVAASSIIRPGVSSSGMMREYILRYRKMPPSYVTPSQIYDILKETYGVMVYQEDVIKVAHFFAGLTLGEADMLRRGMSGKYRGRDEFKKVEEKFFAGCRERGHAPDVAQEVWRQIESFAGYAFSKGHSASYAVESYQSLYLKTYFPLEHMVAVINNFGGFYRTGFYVHEARMCGGIIHAPCINNSNHSTGISGNNIYLGFIHVAGLEQQVSDSFLRERNREGPFGSLAHFMERVPVSVEQLRILVRVGAFRFTGRSKKQLLWDIHSVLGARQKTETSPVLFPQQRKEFTLPALEHSNYDDALDETELLGFPLRNPFDLLRNTEPGPLRAKDMAFHKGKQMCLTGYLVTLKPTRTRQGQPMVFATFNDADGFVFDTVHFPDVAARYPFRGGGCYRITGKITEEFGVYILETSFMERLDFITRNDLMAG